MADTTCCLLVGRWSLVKDDCAQGAEVSVQYREAPCLQDSTAQYSTTRHYAVHCGTAQHGTRETLGMRCTARHSALPRGQYSGVPGTTVRRNTVLEARRHSATQPRSHATLKPRSHTATQPRSHAGTQARRQAATQSQSRKQAAMRERSRAAARPRGHAAHAQRAYPSTHPVGDRSVAACH